MTIKTVNAFAKTLQTMEKTGTVEFLAEMLGYAVDRYIHNDKNALDALVSVAMRTTHKALLGKVLRAAGVLASGKISEREQSIEWKGIKVTHQIRAKKGKKDEFEGALSLITADSLIETYTMEQTEKALEAKRKREELKERKQTPEFWADKIEKVKADAAKYGIDIVAYVKGLAEADEEKYQKTKNA